MPKPAVRTLTLISCAGSFLLLPAGLFAQAESIPAAKIVPAPAQPANEKTDVTLKVGDKAPELTIETWVKGEPVTGFEKGRIYVVEYWATWCGPCRTSIPHLTEMQKKYSKDGVRFIGVTSTDKNLEVVQKFVKDMGEKMDYTVAVDKLEGGQAGKGISNKAWMRASGQTGIPTAFIVDKAGSIAWIGHPMGGLEQIMTKVIAGNFDPKKQAALDARAEELYQKMEAAAGAGKWDDALKLIDEFAALDPDFATPAENQRFQLLLNGKKDCDAAYAVAAKLADGAFKNDAQELNSLAWTMLDTPGLAKKDIPLATRIAQRAVEVSKGENGMILDTLARAYAEAGNLDKAIEIQTKAIEKTSEEGEKKSLQKTLDDYKAKKAAPAEKTEKK